MCHNANRRAQPCIWMSAGLLAYKLCDRDFNCEQCPLDAALSGQTPNMPGRVELRTPREGTNFFPEDRRYSLGHSWVQAIGDRDDQIFRFGLDAFAATMIGRCDGVFCQASSHAQNRGETLCEIDLGLGVLCIAKPIGTAFVARNEELACDPNQLVTAPYGEGWIADLQVQDRSHLHRLVTAHAARDQTRLDLHRFRRQVAIQIFADTEGLGACLPDGGELADLRQMLAGPAYMDLMRELIH
jgi:glycine cleavage system H protein